MKHLIKFEELDYSTYMSAADKFSQLGQKRKAEEVRSHATKMSRKYVDQETFGILVGDVRPFPEAKFTSLSVFKAGESWCLRSLFRSGDYTHRIDSTVLPNGDIVWKEGNKFLDKKSVFKFQKVVSELSKIQDDFNLLFQQSGLKSESLKLVSRTFYA